MSTTTTTAAPTSPESTVVQTTTPQPTVTPTGTPEVTPEVTPGETTPQGAGSFTYKSNNTSVASVSSEGVITAKGNGTTTVTVSYPGLGNKTVTVNVKTKVKEIKLKYNGVEHSDSTNDITQFITVSSGLSDQTIIVTPVFKSNNSHTVTDEYQTGAWEPVRLSSLEMEGCTTAVNGKSLVITIPALANFTKPIQFTHNSTDCGTLHCQVHISCSPSVKSFSVEPTSVTLFTNDTSTQQLTTKFN